MKNYLKISVMALSCMSVLLVAGAATYKHANEKKVTICHIPPGNPANRHTITVSESAVKAHLAHGDVIGPCDSGNGGGGNEGGGGEFEPMPE